MRILRVINNSVVLVKDKGIEKIILGKGIGFKKKKNQNIDLNLIDKIFVMVNTSTDKNYL
ncbi:CAT RNA binding domain-containing protein [Enterococcus gilvus]|uniref:CAT RNA binding domain-containing protein n=1 Tax=Enterococcus gilvus TaxID=160453 RepID=UPI0028D8A629|nr:CAT RNA binding domain-containing protein [Enterococcus gilvus]